MDSAASSGDGAAERTGPGVVERVLAALATAGQLERLGHLLPRAEVAAAGVNAAAVQMWNPLCSARRSRNTAGSA